jgi:anthranilate/para-aminobenzoate synthase component I
MIGVPKISATQFLLETDLTERGPYCGAGS